MPDDERLLELLGQAMATHEPVPPAVTEDARAMFTWRTVDAELLSLGFDSAVDEVAGVRSATTAARLIRFAAGEVEIEVDVVDGGLEGVVLGAEDASRIYLEQPSSMRFDAEVDDIGRFRFSSIAPGPARLRLRLDDTSLVTEWFLV